MKTEFEIVTENGELLTVEYEITTAKNAVCGKKYGICARIKSEDDIIESKSADGKFFTYEEAKRATDMLRKHSVTPCTLCDIL